MYASNNGVLNLFKPFADHRGQNHQILWESCDQPTILSSLWCVLHRRLILPSSARKWFPDLSFLLLVGVSLQICLNTLQPTFLMHFCELLRVSMWTVTSITGSSVTINNKWPPLCWCSSANEGRSCISGKEVYSPEVESSPAPSANDPHMDRSKQSSRTNSFEIENLLKSAEQVTGFCRSPQETRKSSPTGSVASSVSNAMLTPSRQLTDAEKLRKVILELVETEKSYVKVRQVI